MRKAAAATPSIQSLDRGLFILETVARSSNPVGLGQLTTLLGVDRSSAFRLAATLKRRGFLANPAGRKDYILGPSIWRLARKYDWSRILVTLCHPHLRMLAEQSGETAHLAIREGRQALLVDHHTAPGQIIAISGQTGELVPLYCTAHGKALLADYGAAELQALFGAGPLQRYTPRTITTIPRLAKACAAIRESGFTVDDVEFQEGVRCLAAPIRDKDGAVVASIGISAPLIRLPREHVRGTARLVCQVASEVGSGLSAEAQA
jgi:IclR family transcriptional regulator, acetate operon repressor